MTCEPRMNIHCYCRKAPGGVFLSLVKKFATVEEKAAIFGTEKITKYLKRKERKKRLEREQKARQTALEKRMEKWKTEVSLSTKHLYS